MDKHICPRCGQAFPEWQPVHLVCLVSRLKYWLTSLTIVLILPLMLISYQTVSTSLSSSTEKRAEYVGVPTPLAVTEVTTILLSMKQKALTPTPRKLPSTPTSQSAVAAMTIYTPTPIVPPILQGTPKSVKPYASPLAIDFLIDTIEIDSKTLRLHVTIVRQGSTMLDWTSDANRKEEIYLSDISGRYNLVNMGGIFVQDIKLRPQNSYEGWLLFDIPIHNDVVFHYPDVEPISINLSEFGFVEIANPVGSTPLSTITPSPTLEFTPTSTPFVCNKAIKGEFAVIWQRYGARLGCPIQEKPVPNTQIVFVEQPFSKGHMFYFESGGVKFIIVKYGTGTSGTWRSFDDHWDGQNDNHCVEAQEIEPKIVRGFNLVWCNHPEIRDPLGWPLDIERDLDLELAQGFENGFVLRDSDGYTNRLAYLFFNDDTYERVPY